MLPDTYQPPTLTVDNVVFRFIDQKLNVLLGVITSDPYRGEWALPGGFCRQGETSRQAVDRVLVDKAGIDITGRRIVEQLYTFDSIADDPRGHIVSICYMSLMTTVTPQVSNGVPASMFWLVTDLPHIAYNEAPMIEYGLQRLRDMIRTSTAVAALLAPTFTLTELQTAYEVIIGRSFDKRNFRKRFLAYDVLEMTSGFKREGAHRPAQLYQFRSAEITPFVRDF